MQATINVRMDSVMKDRGDAVLKQFGVSTTQAVRALWEYLGKERQLPEFMVEDPEKQAEKERRLAAARKLIEISEMNAGNSGSHLTDEEIKEIIAFRYIEPGDFGESVGKPMEAS